MVGNSFKARKSGKLNKSKFRSTTISLGNHNNVKPKIENKTTAGFYCSNTLDLDKMHIQKVLKNCDYTSISPRVTLVNRSIKFKKNNTKKRATSRVHAYNK